MRSYIPALDSLRAIAVLLVLGFHYGLLDFGWVGVQIFFVLSGYLITQILLEKKNRPLAEYAKHFYIRRSLRIFPLYFAFLIVATALSLTVFAFQLFKEYWPYLYTYTLNWVEPGRVAQLRDEKNDPFYHLWSLSIEEQFYLVWPWLVFFSSRRFFKLLVAVLIIGPALLRIVGFERVVAATGNAEYAAAVVYYLTPFQLDSFAWGALVALAPKVSLKSTRLAAIVGAFAVFIAGYFNLVTLHTLGINEFPFSFGYPPHMTHNSQYAWGYTLLNAASAALILHLITLQNVRGFFSWPALVRMGKVSYGMYILHVPLLMVFSAWVIDLTAPLPLYLCGLVIYCGLVWAGAELSYRFLETPFLKLKERFQ